ncbi:MAG TPA: CinA family protein [Burkholderiales bacterium]|nr:CinA family protein [Burkholderiales bacterium]
MKQPPFDELLAKAERAARLLKGRGETLAVAESSAGGLISAALLAQPGASAYFIGGAALYTRRAILALRATDEKMFEGLRGATEAWALLMARTVRGRCGADWAVGESGAAGPTGNRYGDPPGHVCLAVSGRVERSSTLATGSADRLSNMYAFADAALDLLVETLEQA